MDSKDRRLRSIVANLVMHPERIGTEGLLRLGWWARQPSSVAFLVGSRSSDSWPPEKSWPALDLKRLPPKVLQQARLLLEGEFVDRHENVLAFGSVGSGKPRPP